MYKSLKVGMEAACYLQKGLSKCHKSLPKFLLPIIGKSSKKPAIGKCHTTEKVVYSIMKYKQIRC